MSASHGTLHTKPRKGRMHTDTWRARVVLQSGRYCAFPRCGGLPPLAKL